jgi:hypothetical protein
MQDSGYTLIELPCHGGIDQVDGVEKTQSCKIRLSRSGSGLLSRMYASKGYTLKTSLTHSAGVSSLTIQIDGRTMGTLSIGVDDGYLAAQEIYPEFIESLRERGAIICEFGQLAIDPHVRSKRIMGAIFHIAVLVALHLRGATDAVIEVNPRHVSFYQRMLGFSKVGPERMCDRVQAPAVLLHIHASTFLKNIEKFGGRPEMSTHERSFYPYFFHPREEAGLIKRLRGR